MDKTPAKKLNPGDVILINNRFYLVLDRKHTKIARGTGQVRLKLKSLSGGATQNITKNFGSEDEIEMADYQPVKGQYLYSDEKKHYFMGTENYEQYEQPINQDPNLKYYLKPDREVTLNLSGESLLSVSLPPKVSLKVIQAPPGEKGNTADGGKKQVTLETGLKISTPLFINDGDEILVKTSDNSYVGRK